jgi:fatty-acyl-CoA synthase
MAVVVRTPGQDLYEQELREFCQQRLESFKVPTRIDFVDELPRNPSGKVLKRRLKARYFGQA